MARRYNRNVDEPDLAALQTQWAADLRNAQEFKRDTIGRAYDGAVTRAIRIEAKAVGLLQVVAIGFTAVAIVFTRSSTLLRLLAIPSIVYFALATLSLLQVLRTYPQQHVVSRDALGPAGGLVETAVAASALEARGPVASNFIAGAFRDLQVAGFLAFGAVLLMLVGIGDEPASDAPVNPAPAASTTLAPSVQGSSDATVSPSINLPSYVPSSPASSTAGAPSSTSEPRTPKIGADTLSPSE